TLNCATGEPARSNVNVRARRSTTTRIAVVLVVTLLSLTQPRVPFGRTGSWTCSQPSLRVAVTSRVRTAPNAVRAEKCQAAGPPGTRDTASRCVEVATTAELGDSVDVVTTEETGSAWIGVAWTGAGCAA